MKCIALSMINAFLPFSVFLMYSSMMQKTWLGSFLTSCVFFFLCHVPVLLLPLSYVFIPASGFQLTVLPVTFSVRISKLIHCFSRCPAQSVMHSSCGYTDMMRETLAGESPCWVRNRQARQTLRVRDTQENRAYVGNFVKRKGRTGGERPSSGDRNRGRKEKNTERKGKKR